MNATEMTPKTPSRQRRIKIVSRIVRYVILGFLVFNLGYLLCARFLMQSPRVSLHNPGYLFTLVLTETILCFWYWKLAKLFQFYERGLIFATEAIRCMKTLGFLCVINWLFTSAWYVLGQIFPSPAPPPGRIMTFIPSSFRMDFFSINIHGTNLGLLLAGIVIVIIAWIMDEGRKIQEEQELTV